MNPKNKVDLTNPELTIIVEVIKSVCCVSVVRHYTLFRKYNLQEVIKDDTSKQEETGANQEVTGTKQEVEPEVVATNQEEKEKQEVRETRDGEEEKEEKEKEVL